MLDPQAATLLVVVLLHFLSPDPALNALAPRDGITRSQAVAYGEGPRRGLDVYAPRAADGSDPPAVKAPVIVFFYGGGWVSGAKETYRYVGSGLAARGVVVVIPDYRLHPEVEFPAFMEDAAAAVGWAHANAVRFGGDPHRLFLMGHSAGGQIATLLALDPKYLSAVGLSASRDVCGVIGLAAPYDFLPNASAGVQAVFGPQAGWPDSQPVNYVSAQAPPMLLLAGADDHTVDPGNTVRLASRLRAASAPVSYALYPDISHIAMIEAFSSLLGFLAPVRAATLHFVAQHTACGG